MPTSPATCARNSPWPRRPARLREKRGGPARRAAKDVLPGEIDANLGAPWIPTSDIQAFAAELFGIGHPRDIQIGHFKKTPSGAWTPTSA